MEMYPSWVINITFGYQLYMLIFSLLFLTISSESYIQNHHPNPMHSSFRHLIPHPYWLIKEGASRDDVKREAPSGPNKMEPPLQPLPPADMKRMVPNGPNPMEPPLSSLISRDEKRLVPNGSNPVEPPLSSLISRDEKRSVPNEKRMVLSGPNPMESPDPSITV
ncbi:unnamed protein product [Cuscuta europaea]|uniref:Uncharacterized protein n=1 Tax=Cuscuta europaea TaxID=41803 RepID=A0A9P1EL86_CUSEU|nr:unnamed protein product [Cuscuta europaea]